MALYKNPVQEWHLIYMSNMSECERPRQRKHSTVFWQSVNDSNYHGGPTEPKKYSAPEQKILSGQTDRLAGITNPKIL